MFVVLGIHLEHLYRGAKVEILSTAHIRSFRGGGGGALKKIHMSDGLLAIMMGLGVVEVPFQLPSPKQIK